ncbi:hypothetical protein Ahia01_000543600 [Argonauta hians]
MHPPEYNAQVPCLSGILDLQRMCQQENVKFSSETNRYLVYLMLKKVGPMMASKLLDRLIESGEILWDKDEKYEVEAVVDHTDEEDVNYYYIKWKGWSTEFNTWEPESNLECHELIEEYHRRKAAALKSRKRSATGDNNSGGNNNSAAAGAGKGRGEVVTVAANKRKRVEELFDKLFRSPVRERITPMQIMSLTTVRHSRTGAGRDGGGGGGGRVVVGGGGGGGGGVDRIIKGLMTCRGRKLRKFRYAADYNNTKSKHYRQTKHMVQDALREWQDKLNAVCADPAPICVENDVDLEGPPENFEYINDYKAMDGIEIPQDPLVGCECTDCLGERRSCCPANCGTEFAYYRGKRLRVGRGIPIYECNRRCKCGPECPNRVVQQGRKFKVCVFRTSNGRGWGVKTVQKIKRGSFVMEYVGEVITNEEAERRGKRYDAEGRTYLFDLDYNDGDCPFTVDAGYYGNVSHFVNHSCDPNLEVFGVWINTLDPRLPRIALFAKRDIAKGEELTFDYMMTVDANQSAFNTSASNMADPDPHSPGGGSKEDEEEEDDERGGASGGGGEGSNNNNTTTTATTTATTTTTTATITATNNNNDNDTTMQFDDEHQQQQQQQPSHMTQAPHATTPTTAVGGAAVNNNNNNNNKEVVAVTEKMEVVEKVGDGDNGGCVEMVVDEREGEGEETRESPSLSPIPPSAATTTTTTTSAATAASITTATAAAVSSSSSSSTSNATTTTAATTTLATTTTTATTDIATAATITPTDTTTTPPASIESTSTTTTAPPPSSSSSSDTTNNTTTTTTTTNNNNNNDDNSTTTNTNTTTNEIITTTTTGTITTTTTGSSNDDIINNESNATTTTTVNTTTTANLTAASTTTTTTTSTTTTTTAPRAGNGPMATSTPRRKTTSATTPKLTDKGKQYRIVCQCGAANCRKYLF